MTEASIVPLDLSPLWISLRVAAIATLFTFFAGTAVAYGMLNYRGKAKSLLEGILISPLILPPTVVGFVLLVVFGKNGSVGQLLGSIEVSVVFTWYGAVIAATVVSFPLMYRTAQGAFEQIDQNLLAVARTLGASEWTVFRRVLLPLALPGLLAGIVLAFARSLGEFGATLMIAGNIPGQTQTVPMAIYFAVEAGATNEAWFWTVIILLISLSGIVAVNLWQRQSNPKLQGRQTQVKAVHSDRKHTLRSLQADSSESRPGLWLDLEKHSENFNLQVALSAGQHPLGILGSSGSGKSMTLRCIAGVETPTVGKIVLNGRTLFDSEQQINVPSHQRNISLVFQDYALFPHLTIAQNIAFGLQHLPKSRQAERVAQQLALVQLQSLGNRYPHQLSGGQQQRVALARALVTEPEALLLDEPFSALDTHLRSQMERQLIETLSMYQGVTVFVTHNLEEAYRICETLLVMSSGMVLMNDSKHQIFEHPRTVPVAQITGCKNFSRAIVQHADRIEAIDWGISLQVAEAIPEELSHVGIRAEQLSIVGTIEQQNTYPCWLTTTSEAPHRITLFLRFNTAPTHPQDYHVQAEISKECWNTIKNQPFPWYVWLNPLRLMPLAG